MMLILTVNCQLAAIAILKIDPVEEDLENHHTLCSSKTYEYVEQSLTNFLYSPKMQILKKYL